MRLHTLLFASLLLIASCSQQKETQVDQDDSGVFSIVFYNVENLFDTADDPLTADEEFTPSGSKAWTAERYSDKLRKLSEAIHAGDPTLPELIGLCEVENEQVVRDLLNEPSLRNGNYGVIHKDSPDGRGIDCALAYRKDKLNIVAQEFFTTQLPVGDRPNTRDVLYAVAVSGNDSLHVFVNHWPSRSGGQEASEPNRLTIALLVKQKVDGLLAANPNARIVLMGDFNDHPNDRSLKDVLQASGRSDAYLYNFMESMHKSGEGTYNYKGDWGTLDQFIVSPSVLNAESGFSASEQSARIVKEPFLLFVSPDGKSSPSRTYGKDYYGGYSDHLPIVLDLTRK